MSITSKKITAYSKTHQMLPPVPSPAFSAADLQLWYDTAAEEARLAINGIVDALGATTTGDSGAEAIGVEPIVGIGATNVQDALEQLRLLLNDATAGSIPNGTLGPEKLNFDVATQAELDTHIADTVNHVPYALATGTANIYVATLTPAPTSYARGMAVSVEINALNSGASTININGLGAKTIKKSNGNDVSTGQLKVGIIYTLRYNGTNFILQGEGGSGNATSSDILSNKTASTDQGEIVGSMPNQGAVTIIPSASAQVIPTGYHNGSGSVPAVAGLDATKIQKDHVIAGVTGTFNPQQAIYAYSSTLKSTTSTSMVSLKRITVSVSGTFRISFDMATSTNGSTAYGQIFKNGVATGTLQSTASVVSNYVNFSQDFTGNNAGDFFELKGQASANTCYVKNFEIRNVPTLTNATINVD